jgi:hypothetical protein
VREIRKFLRRHNDDVTRLGGFLADPLSRCPLCVDVTAEDTLGFVTRPGMELDASHLGIVAAE